MSAFTSNLSVAAHHAIRSVGFTPVGQVMGTSVHAIDDYSAFWSCGVRIREITPLSNTLALARRNAVRRMGAECANLGGDGVVAVRLTVREMSASCLEFQAIGTAVRADGAVRARNPFLSHLSGQDFATLVTAGWLPCGVVLGVAVTARHAEASGSGPWEDKGQSMLVSVASRTAHKQVRDEAARGGGQGVLLRTAKLRTWQQKCRVGPRYGTRLDRDCLVEAVLLGTAIIPVRDDHQVPASQLVLGLNA